MPSESAILLGTLALPAVGAAVIQAIPATHARAGWTSARTVATAFCTATLVLAILAATWVDFTRADFQLIHQMPWLASVGFHFSLGVDGFAMPLVILAAVAGLVVCWSSYNIKRSVKAYFSTLLLFLSASLGVFTALDLGLLVAFVMLALAAMYFLAWGGAGGAGWGTDLAPRAARRFLLYILLAVVLLIAALAGIYSHVRDDTGFDLVHFAQAVRGVPLFWIAMLTAGFAALLPVFPLHRWLADLVAQSSTPVAMLLLAVAQILPAYALIRACFPLFAAGETFGWVTAIALTTLIYATLAALAQKDLMRQIACASIAQMALLLLGLAAWNATALSGAALLLVAHSLSMGGVVFVAGMIRDRAGHVEIARLGGLGAHMPAFAGWSAFAFFSAAGMPALAPFAAQLLLFLGIFNAQRPATLSGTFSPSMPAHVVWIGLSTIAAMLLLAGSFLWTFQRVFLGPPRPEHSNLARMSGSEKWILALLALASVTAGIAPSLLTEPSRAALEKWFIP